MHGVDVDAVRTRNGKVHRRSVGAEAALAVLLQKSVAIRAFCPLVPAGVCLEKSSVEARLPVAVGGRCCTVDQDALVVGRDLGVVVVGAVDLPPHDGADVVVDTDLFIEY